MGNTPEHKTQAAVLLQFPCNFIQVFQQRVISRPLDLNLLARRQAVIFFVFFPILLTLSCSRFQRAKIPFSPGGHFTIPYCHFSLGRHRPL